jgi:fatty acid-binding protein DegV
VSAVAICTDSSALLPRDVAERLGVIVVPIVVTLDGEPFDEGREPVDRFYDRLSAGAEATTALPSPGEFLAAFERAAQSGAAQVISIHLDARVSGTLHSAELAARDAPLPVTVVDAGTVSFGVGVCVRAAAEAVLAGASVGEVAAIVTRLGRTMRNVFVAPGAPRGRVRHADEWAVLEFSDAQIQQIAACESLDEARDRMVEQVLGPGRLLRTAVGHAAPDAQPAADALATALARSTDVVGVERYRVGPSVGAHTGPSSFGAFWWPAAS